MSGHLSGNISFEKPNTPSGCFWYALGFMVFALLCYAAAQWLL